MNQRNAALLGALLCIAACSVLNAPDALLPIPESGGANDTGGTSTTAGTETGGTTSQAGEGAASPQAGAGAVPGVGGCSSGCDEGGAPPIGRDCTISSQDCGSTAPICDAADGTCRACKNDAECKTEVAKNFCATSGASAGRCVTCKAAADCSGRTPVCSDVGQCVACSANDECDSGVCESTGACGATTAAVYALAQTGIIALDCGSVDTPCRNLKDAVTHLSATRNRLVLLKTAQAFDGGASLPAVKGLRVIGNGDTVHTYDQTSGFSVGAGANVTFENLVVEGSTADKTGGIVCEGGAITILNSTLQSNGNGVLANDCDVTVTGSLLSKNASPLMFSQAALKITCTAATCPNTSSILRNKFVDNGVAVSIWDQAKSSVENNLFLRNGSAGYTRVIELRADATHFAYNTLVENFNDCTYVGIVACDSGVCTDTANISFNNFPGQNCLDQVWYGSNNVMTYNLTEIAYPGATNHIGDPKFVDAAKGDFTPGAGSPAIDKGDPKDTPPFDLNGNKRPLGIAPDVGAIEAQ